MCCRRVQALAARPAGPPSPPLRRRRRPRGRDPHRPAVCASQQQRHVFHDVCLAKEGTGAGGGKPAGDGGKDPKGRAGGAGSVQPAATGRGRRPTTAALDGSPRSRHLPKRQTTHLKDSERDRGKTDFKDAAFQTRHLVTVPRWTRGARRPRPCHCGGEAAGSAHSTRPATARAGGPCARLRGRAGSAPAASAGGMRAPDAAGRWGRRRRLPCNGHASLGWRDPANLADAGQEVAGGRRRHLSQPGTAAAGQAPRRPAEGRGEPRRRARGST